MSEVKSLIAEIKSKGLLRAGDKLELLYVVAAQLQDNYAALKAERDALAAESTDWQQRAEAAEETISYLDAEAAAVPRLLQELGDKMRERNTDAVRQQDDSLLDGILALAGASFAVAGSDMPNYKVKAARLWPWNHPKHENETATQKFNRVFYKDTPIKSFRDRLVWSAVLIMAEIEKHDRKRSLANDAKK